MLVIIVLRAVNLYQLQENSPNEKFEKDYEIFITLK